MSQTQGRRLQQTGQTAQPIQASTLSVTNNTDTMLKLQGSLLGVACTFTWDDIGTIPGNGHADFRISDSYRYYFLSYMRDFEQICEYVQTFVRDSTGSTTYEVTINDL